MERMPETSSAEMSAVVINAAIRDHEGESVSYHQLAQEIGQMGIETPEVATYISTLRRFSHNAVIAPLPEGVGGQFDGSITIATSTIEIGDSGASQTIARMQEVYDHELYHALNKHTDAMMTWDSDATVMIAGEGFSTTEIIEGLTVAETGEDFVSDRYRDHKKNLLSSIVAASLSLDDVRDAVNTTKDLTWIDDRRDPMVEKQLSLAA